MIDHERITGCPARCPGCSPRHLDPEESANRKTAWLKNRLAPWADRFLPLAAPAPDRVPGYRQKACLSAVWGADGWAFGLKVRREVVPVPGCPLHSDCIRRALEILSPVLPPPADFPLVYWAQSGAQIVLVLKSSRAPGCDWLDAGTAAAFRDAGIDGIWLHLFPAAGKRVFAKPGWNLAWGAPRSRGADGFIYGPTAFQQVFPALHEAALDRAEAFLDPGPGGPVIDLYSGIGRTLARWDRRGAGTAGGEMSGEAVECAMANVPRATVFRGACTHRIPQLDEWLLNTGGRNGWRLYANPPRTGLEPEVTRWVTERRPEKIAYLSCSAGTLRRDLDLLCGAGYRVTAVAPYDFFPRTRHVETLVLLEK